MIASHVEKRRRHHGRRASRCRSSQAHEFGVHERRPERNRVDEFAEKPQRPEAACRAATGIASPRWASTSSTREFLARAARCEDAADEQSKHDFGKNIIPEAIDDAAGVRLSVPGRRRRARSATGATSARSTRTTSANMELVHVRPELNIYDEDWPIWTYQLQQPPREVHARRGRPARHGDQLDGVGRLHHLRRRGARVAAVLATCGSTSARALQRSVVLPHVEIGRSCDIASAIIDEDCEIPHGMTIGATARRTSGTST